MPTQKMVAIQKDEVYTKYRTLSTAHGASNRPVNPAAVARFRDTLDTMGDAGIALLQTREVGVYEILDGQHRLAAIARYGNGRPYMAVATIWTTTEAIERHGSVAQLVSNLNKGRSFSTSDRLAVFKDQSPWPAIFLRRGLQPSFKNTRAAGYSWGAIVRACLAAKHGKFSGSMCTPGEIEAAWLDYPEKEIAAMADAMVWWLPVAKSVWDSHEIGSMFKSEALAVVAAIHKTNTPAQLGGAPSAVSRDPGIGILRSLHGRNFAERLIQALNYKRHARRITLPGWDGRD